MERNSDGGKNLQIYKSQKRKKFPVFQIKFFNFEVLKTTKKEFLLKNTVLANTGNIQVHNWLLKCQ